MLQDALPVDGGEDANLALRCFGTVSINRCIGTIVFLMVCSWLCQLLYYKVLQHFNKYLLSI